MIHLLSRAELNASAWNALVDASANGRPYARAWYLDRICRRWDALVAESTGGYAAGLPLPSSRSLRHFGRRVVAPPLFAQQLGLFRTGVDAPGMKAFLDAVPDRFARVRLQLSADAGNPPEIPGWRIEERPNYVLDLGGDVATLRAGYRDNAKRNLRKAEKAGLRIGEAFDRDAFLRSLVRHQGPNIRGLRRRDYALAGDLIDEGLRRGEGRGVAARDDRGALHAAAFVLTGPRGPVYLFGTTAPVGRRTGAMTAVFDRIVAEHAGGGFLDFEGSRLPGLARFFAAFGAVNRPYWTVERIAGRPGRARSARDES